MREKGRLAEGMRILREETAVERLAPGRRNYEVLIGGLYAEWEVEDAAKLQAEMAGEVFRNTSEVYNAFVGGYRIFRNKH